METEKKNEYRCREGRKEAETFSEEKEDNEYKAICVGFVQEVSRSKGSQGQVLRKAHR